MMQNDHGPAAGLLEDGRHALPIRVYYEDTDFSGVVYHASYLRFLERGRTEFIRALGVDQQALYREEGVAFVVRTMQVDFLRPARMDDVIRVETAVREARGPVLRLDQAIGRDGERLTEAVVTVVCVRGGRPSRLPARLAAAFGAARRGQAVPSDGRT